mgnify:CR=1 FL=1
MNYNIKADRPTIVVGASLGIILLLFLYTLLHFWILRQGYVSEIDTIQPRTSRRLGIMDSMEELESASGTASGMLQELA